MNLNIRIYIYIYEYVYIYIHIPLYFIFNYIQCFGSLVGFIRKQQYTHTISSKHSRLEECT